MRRSFIYRNSQLSNIEIMNKDKRHFFPAFSVAILLIVSIFALLQIPQGAFAQSSPQISLPLKDLSDLIQSSEDRTPRYAFGAITGTARFTESDHGSEMSIQYSGTIQSYTDIPTFVPLLPVGIRLQSFSSNNTSQAAAVSGTSQGIVITGKGSLTISLAFSITAIETSDGIEFTVPTFGGQGEHLSAMATKVLGMPTITPTTRFDPNENSSGAFAFEAEIPRTDAFYVRFAKIGGAQWTIGHVDIEGSVTKEARDTFGSQWRTKLDVDLFRSNTAQIPLLPESIALRSVSVNQAAIPLLVKDGIVHAILSGNGHHTIDLLFDVAATYENGVPSLRVPIVNGATRSLSVTLPGDQEVQVQPAGGVQRSVKDGHTTISAALPRSQEVHLSWREAVPEQQERVSTTASIWHRFRSEEGILLGDATVDIEIKQGGIQSITIELPSDIQIDSISSTSATVVDWRAEDSKDGHQKVTAYLDRRVEGSASLFIRYDMPLPVGIKKSLPLVSIPDTSRQRGAVALIGTREAGLRVDEEATLTRVSESGFPSEMMKNLPGKLTYAFKYTTTPTVTIAQTPPQKVEGRFNARLESILSVGEVGVHGAIEGVVEIKTGRLALLQVELPKGPQILSVVAPSLREQRVIQQDNRQLVEIEFTQEMEGSFRFEIAYELLVAQDFTETTVPMVHVLGADVDRGKLAIESRSATEVSPFQEANLTSEDPAELGTALIARTSHPILKAYSYVWQTKAVPALQLKLKRHKKQELPAAKIVTATYETKLTMQGSSTTSAKLVIANVREQFLRVKLPDQASFLNVTVEGRPETPVSTEGEPGTYLIKLITREQGFEVFFTYVTESPSLGMFSLQTLQLPVISLHSETERWRVSLPEQETIVKVLSPFDREEFRSTSSLALARNYTAANTEQVASLYLISLTLKQIISILSLVLLPCLYFVWAMKKPSNAALAIVLTLIVIAASAAAIAVDTFSLQANIVLALLLIAVHRRPAISQLFTEKGQDKSLE